MNVLSVRRVRGKDLWNVKVDMTLEEHNIMFIAGLQSYANETGAKVRVIPIKEAKKVGVKPKNTWNVSDEEANVFVGMACTEALTQFVKREQEKEKSGVKVKNGKK